jgi:hypothetical protein
MDHARAGIKLALGTQDSSTPLLEGATKMGAEEDSRGLLRRKAFAQLKAQKGQLLVGNGKADLHGIGGIEPGDITASTDKLTYIDGFLAHNAVIGGAKGGALEVPLSAGDRAFPGPEPGFRNPQAPLGAF